MSAAKDKYTVAEKAEKTAKAAKEAAEKVETTAKAARAAKDKAAGGDGKGSADGKKQ